MSAPLAVVAHVVCRDPARAAVTTWFRECLTAWSELYGGPGPGTVLHVALAEQGGWAPEKSAVLLELADPGPGESGRPEVDLSLILTDDPSVVGLAGYLTTIVYTSRAAPRAGTGQRADSSA